MGEFLLLIGRCTALLQQSFDGLASASGCSTTASWAQIPPRPWRSAHSRLVVLLGSLIWTATLAARDLSADPSNYRNQLATLRPGDRLLLAAGDYTHGMVLEGLSGTAQAPITIQGAAPPGRSRFLASPGRNTISLRNVGHIVIDGLTLDGQGLPVDAVKAERTASHVDHLTLSRLTIVGYGAGQQMVGISSKCPAYGWVVRANVIVGAGTGMYFGDSDGTAPFVGALIEDNLIVDTIGYNLQIKHQLLRPARSGLPDEPVATVLRRNVFAKGANSATGNDARPNVLLGHQPPHGVGTGDQVLLYENVFLDNPSEALLQAEGHASIYNNIFFNGSGDGVVVRPHNQRPRNIALFRNTIMTQGSGLTLAGTDPRFEQLVLRNAIFADGPVAGFPVAANLLRPFAPAYAAMVSGQPLATLPDFGHLAEAPLATDISLPQALLSLPGARADLFGRVRRDDRPGASASAGSNVSAYLALVARARALAHVPAPAQAKPH